MATRALLIPAPRRLSRCLALASVLSIHVGGAVAQPVGVNETVEVGFSGRTFEGIEFRDGPQRHDLVLAGDHAFSWKDEATDRIVLDHDAVVTLGPFTFRAERAAVWIERADGQGVPAKQVAVFLENVRDAGAAPGAIPGPAQGGRELLVTAILLEPELTLRADLLTRERPDGEFVVRAEERLARYLAGLTGQAVVEPPPEFELPYRAGAPARTTAARPPSAPGRRSSAAPSDRTSAELEGARAETLPELYRDTRPPMAPAERVPARTPTTGAVSFFAEDIRLVEPDGESSPTLMMFGGVAVQVQSDALRDTVQLTAERAVVFLGETAEPGLSRYAVDSVIGIYAEGDVSITNGDYHFRGSRTFYDPRTSRALALDAVFWTYDSHRGMPLYVRADAIRQEAENQWSSESVTLANVAFAEPHFSIGARNVTITREVSVEDATARTYIEAEGVGFKAGDATLIGVPKASGEPRPSPLRDVRIGRSGGSGFVSTRWDLHALFGSDPSPGNRADLLLDGWFERGPAVGLDLAWDQMDMAGDLFGYFIYDNGTDVLTSGAEIDQDNESRGMILAENAWQLSDEWSFFLEGSYISDPTFVDAFFEPLAETRREFANSIYFRRLKENGLLSIEARGTFNDFIVNEYLLQSLGYQVEKLPELRYWRVAEQVLEYVSYTAQVYASRMNLVFNQPRLENIGFDTPERSFAGFDLPPEASLAGVLSAEGYSENSVFRFDTRHEIEIPLNWGPVNLVPFAVGRFTAYDTDFSGFRDSRNNDKERFWGSTGVRAATSIVHVDNSTESELFDVHGVRHIVEPSVSLWVGGSTIAPEDLPVYDYDVEPLKDGTVVRLGARQTWQTKRGRRGDRQSVDWITLNADYVWSSDDAFINSPFGRFIEARPELSNLGEFIQGDVGILVTDAVTYVGEILYDLDNRQLARFSTGIQIDHGEVFSTFAEYRFLNEFDSTFLNLGARYELTRKYAALAFIKYDLDESDFQRFGFAFTRRFQQWTFSFDLDLDNIADDVGLGVSLRPVGFGDEDRLRIFTYDEVGSVVPDDSPDRLRPTRLGYGPFE